MWRLYHKLFGWEYITYHFAGATHTGRVKTIGLLIYVNIYNSWHPIDRCDRGIYPCTITAKEIDSTVEYNKSQR